MYIPQVNDYVIWEDGLPGKNDEGWVYFDTGELEEKKGFRKHMRYITLETGIKPRPICQIEESLNPKVRSPRHKYVHTLLLCFEKDWHQLKYIKSRPNCKSKDYYDRFKS